MNFSKNDISASLASPFDSKLTASDWLSLVEKYPYCEIFLWHYLRVLYCSDAFDFENELLRLGIRISNRSDFYLFMTSKKPKQDSAEYNLVSTDYFSHADSVTAERHESLRQLARKLREKRIEEQSKHIENEKVDYVKLIKEKRYSEALEILRQINLENPKKSRYFAVQIRYLETILNNNK
ncbi:MAG: hypothetical protein MJZ93_00995 [Paludibacteraceae bacterium]|nr:hypothetical protein [Paludibacteraceae bacterium]